MRVLQITAFSGVGCTGKIAKGISELLIENGHEATIAWGRKNGISGGVSTVRIGSRWDYMLHIAYARLSDRNGFASVRATKRFIAWMEQYHPDIVHLHILHGYYINISILFSYLKEKNIPVVWTFHDEWAFTGHCPCFRMTSCEKWKMECNNCIQSHEHPSSLLLDRSRKNYHDKKRLFTGINKMVIVSPSKWMKGLVEESFFKDFKAKVIHNGIDTECFKPTAGNIKERLGIKDKKLVLGVSSTWAESKGIADFYLLSEMLDKDYKIVMVGLNSRQLSEMPKGIIGIKHTDSVRELAELYSAAEVFCNLTYDDNYPTTNLEAVACGTPVVTYATGGSVEIVEQTGYGRVVDRGKVEDVAKAICELSDMPKKREGFRDVNQKKCYQEYLKLYEEILK